MARGGRLGDIRFEMGRKKGRKTADRAAWACAAGHRASRSNVNGTARPQQQRRSFDKKFWMEKGRTNSQGVISWVVYCATAFNLSDGWSGGAQKRKG